MFNTYFGSLQRKNNLAPSELEFVRIVLNDEGFDITDIDCPNAIAIIAEILNQNNLSIDPQHVMTGLQNLTFEDTATKNPIYPLHLAARQGDLANVKNLVQSGYKVNSTDIFGSTPLHMASMYGHQTVADFLLKQGANIQAKTYQEYYGSVYHTYTPLDLALKYAPNSTIIDFLLTNGAQPDNWQIATDILTSVLIDAATQNDFNNYSLVLSKFEKLAKNHLDKMWVDDGQGTEKIPITLVLENMATYLNNPAMYMRTYDTIDLLKALDNQGIHAAFTNAKSLLHAFPSENVYQLKAGNFKSILEAEGFWPIYTTELGAKSLYAFVQTLDGQDNEMKKAVFTQMYDVFAKATDATHQASIPQVSEALYQDYLAGKTLLLPSGWSGHAVDIIVNKDLNLFMVANAGQRFFNLPPGLNGYHQDYPLDATKIYHILNNPQQMELEFRDFYDLGLTKNPDFSLFVPSQQYGNCTWYSHQIAERALIFIETFKATQDVTQAKSLTEAWFKELDNFHQNTVLETYLTAPKLDVAALGDILIHYHANPVTPDEKNRSIMILNEVTHSHNKKAFDQYYKQHQTEFSATLKAFAKENGFTLGNNTNAKYLNLYKDTPTPLAIKEIISMIDTDCPLAKLNGAKTAHEDTLTQILESTAQPATAIPIIFVIEDQIVLA